MASCEKRSSRVGYSVVMLFFLSVAAWLAATSCLLHLSVETECGIVWVGLGRGVVSVNSWQCDADPAVRPELWSEISFVRQSSRRAKLLMFNRLPQSTNDWEFVLPSWRWREGVQGLDPGDEKLLYTTSFALPLWLPAVCLLAMSVLVIFRQQRWRRETQCSQCRYDLTGNESGVCPECGNAIPDLQRAWLEQIVIVTRSETRRQTSPADER